MANSGPRETPTSDAVRHHVARVDFNPLTFGQMLRVLMVERSLTLAHMSALTGLHANVLSKIRLGTDPNSRLVKSGGKVFRPTPETVARIIRGLNVIYPVPPQQVAQLFLKVGHAPPMPYVVSSFSTHEQIVVAFDGRAWIPDGGIFHDGEPIQSATGSGVWSTPVNAPSVIRTGLTEEPDPADLGGRAEPQIVGAVGHPQERGASGQPRRRYSWRFDEQNADSGRAARDGISSGGGNALERTHARGEPEPER